MPFTKEAREGKQGSHKYYLTTFTWGELDQLAVLPEDLGDLDEEHTMQRSLAKKRIIDLADYLVEAKDHFFSALTMIALPRDLTRPAKEAKPETEDDEWDYYFERTSSNEPGTPRAGKLFISGDARLFPADGQHRLRGAREAMTQNKSLSREEVPVVVIPFTNADQVRQLFSDLNLNAKVVSKTIGLAFESRDPITQLAKRLAKEIPLFDGRVNRVTNSLSETSLNVISLNTLVMLTTSLAEAFAKAANVGSAEEFVKTKEAPKMMHEALEIIIGAFEDKWQMVIDGKSPDPDQPNAAGYLRKTYVFPHGLGWQALGQAAQSLMGELGLPNWADALRRGVQAIHWERTHNETWDGKAVIYDPIDEDGDGKTEPTNRVNNTGPGVQATAKFIHAVSMHEYSNAKKKKGAA